MGCEWLNFIVWIRDFVFYVYFYVYVFLICVFGESWDVMFGDEEYYKFE